MIHELTELGNYCMLGAVLQVYPVFLSRHTNRQKVQSAIQSLSLVDDRRSVSDREGFWKFVIM